MLVNLGLVLKKNDDSGDDDYDDDGEVSKQPDHPRRWTADITDRWRRTRTLPFPR